MLEYTKKNYNISFLFLNKVLVLVGSYLEDLNTFVTREKSCLQLKDDCNNNRVGFDLNRILTRY